MSLYQADTESLKWVIPGFMSNDKVLLLLFDILNDIGEENHVVSVYGSPRTPWNAGRRSSVKNIDLGYLEELISVYNSFSVYTFFTFNNYNILDSDIEHPESNAWLSILDRINGSNGMKNGVIVASDYLRDYIRANYEHVPVIASVIKPIYEKRNDDSYYNRLLESYDYVTPRPEYFINRLGNNSEPTNKVSSKSILLEDKEKFIVLCNQTCVMNCKSAIAHYESFNAEERGGLFDSRVGDLCLRRVARYNHIGATCNMSSGLINRLVSLGFKYFKLQGRDYKPNDLLYEFGTYIFEPKGVFQDIVSTICANVWLSS